MVELEDRVVILEEHVSGVNKESPGLLMRMDRVEVVAKAMLALAALGFGAKLLDFLGALMPRHTP